MIQGGHGNDKGRQTVFFTPLNPFGGDSGEEEPSDDYAVPQKVHFHSHWKRNQDAVYWATLSRAQDQGLQFWQTKSHAIMVHSRVPADCIFGVISQIGDRTLLERLSTPRRAPKVTLKSNWLSQQQQPICDDVSTGTRRLAREIQSGTRDVRGYTTDDQTSTGRLVRDPEPAVEKKSHNSKLIFE